DHRRRRRQHRPRRRPNPLTPRLRNRRGLRPRPRSLYTPPMANEPHRPPEARDTSAPGTRPSAQLEKLARLYRQMLLIRRLEEECARAYADGKIGGFLHLYIGQEAVGVGALSALKPDDYVVTTYRDHGIALAKGMSAKTLLAELWGKRAGCSQGL